MTHAFSSSSPTKQVRDTRTGRTVEVRGAGALKDRILLQAGVDLTKPIFEQAAKLKPAPHQPSKS